MSRSCRRPVFGRSTGQPAVIDLGLLTRSGRLGAQHRHLRAPRQLRAQALEETPRPEGFVPATTLWWIDGTQYLGRLQIRHRLTRWLRDVGGHIGYDIRPTARNKGHATAMLHAAKPYTHQLGIDPALVTCDQDNHASIRVIERNGGILQDQRGTKLRYWVPTC